MLIRRLFSRVVLFSIALALALGTLTTLWVTQPQAAEAANLSVNDTSDSLAAGDGKCTLREAIINANTDSDTTGGDCATGSGADNIDIPAGIYTLTLGLELLIDSDLTLTGDGVDSTIIQAATAPDTVSFRVLFIGGGSNVGITGITIRHGNNLNITTGNGIFNSGVLTLTNSTVSNNHAIRGGGIYNSGILILVNSTVSNNTAGEGGGGIRNDNTLTLIDSTVSNNTGGSGGGIWNHAFGILNLTNSTVSNNTAPGSRGGGIFNNGGALTLTNSTVSNNHAASLGGGIAHESGHPLPLANSLIAINLPSDCSRGGGGVVTSLGHNLDSDGTCNLTEPTDLPNTVNPKLGPLADNGGPTETHALLPDSPAIDHIPAENCEVITDQRGVARPQGSGCDIGAYEFEPPPAAPDLTIDKDDGGVTAMPGDTITYTLNYDNVGNQDATGVVITDTVPANTTFNPGSSTAGWACAPDNNAGSTCTFTIGSLPVGGGAMVDFAADVDDPLAASVTLIVNGTRISDDGIHGVDQNPGDNSDIEFTRIAGARPVGGTSIFLGDDSDSTGGGLAVLAGSVAGALALLVAGGWYARRHWLRRG